MPQYFQSGAATQRARARINARAQAQVAAQRAKEKSDNSGGGGFGLGDLVPDIGVGQLVKELGAIPSGLAALATGKGGYGHAWSSFGKGVLTSFAGTAKNLDPTTWPRQFSSGLFDTPALSDIGSDFMNKTLSSTDAEEKSGIYRPKDFTEKSDERGLLPALVEDVGNAALAGGAIAKIAKVGTVGKLANAARTAEEASKAGFTAGEVARAAEVAGEKGTSFSKAGIGSKVLKAAGKAAEKADGLEAPAEAIAKRGRTIGRAEAVAHPYLSVFNNVVRPITRAAQAADTARAAGPVLEDVAGTVGKLDEAAPVPVSTNGEAILDGAVTPQAPWDPDAQAYAGPERRFDATGTPEDRLGWDPETGTPRSDRDLTPAEIADEEAAIREFTPEYRRPDPEPYAGPERRNGDATGTPEDRLGFDENDVPRRDRDLTPEEQAAEAEAIGGYKPEYSRFEDGGRAAAAAADQEAIAPRRGPSEERYREAVQKPIPPWAQKTVERMPDAAQHIAARIEGFIEGRAEAKGVYRERERFQEAERRRLFHHPAVQASVKAARDHLVGEEMPDGTTITPAMANELVGDEIFARMEGTTLLEAAVVGLGADPVEVRKILAQTGARNAEQIPTDWLFDDAGNPTALSDQIDEAVGHWRGVLDERPKHLRGSRLGDRGIEDIGSDELTMTKAQNKAMRALAKHMERSRAFEARIVAERARAEAGIVKGEGRVSVVDAVIENLERQKAKAVEDVKKLYGDKPPGEGSIRQLASRLSKLADETPAAARRRGYKAGLAVERFESAELRIKAAVERKVRLDKGLEDVRTSIIEHSLPSELEKAKIDGHVQRGLDRLARQLETPGNSQVPTQWKPLWGAFKDLHEAAEKSPALAAALEDMPQTWENVLRIATENGFDPTHLNSIPESSVKELVYGQVRLGAHGRAGQNIVAGQRKVRLGNQAMTRSVEGLAAGLLQATHEANSNALVTYLDDVVAKPIVNDIVPKGWVPWDDERNFILRGERTETGDLRLSGSGAKAKKMIPVEVKRTIDSFSKDYSHGIFKNLTKILNPWRALVLTMSPRWYVNNFMGNVLLASVEGVKIRDWISALHSYRRQEGGTPFSDIPEVTHSSLLSDFGGEPSMIPYPKGKEGLRVARKTGGIKEAGSLGMRKLARANEVVDEMARAAVYHRSMRVGMTPEQALTRSFTALVDYGDLGPFERQVVRAAVPFYAWQKGILKLVAKFPIDHPIAAGIGLQLAELNRELNRDQYGGDLPEAYAGFVDLPLIGTVSTRGMNPFQDSAQLVTPQGIASSLNPALEIGVRNAFGAPEGGFATHYRENEFGQLVPDTSPAEDLQSTGFNLPQFRLGAGLTGNLPEGQPTGVQAAERFVGAGTYSPVQVQKIVDRVKKARKRQAGSRTGG